MTQIVWIVAVAGVVMLVISRLSTAVQPNRSKSRSKTAITGPTPHDSADRAESRFIEKQPSRVDCHSTTRPLGRNDRSIKNPVGGRAQSVSNMAGSRPPSKSGGYQWTSAGG